MKKTLALSLALLLAFTLTATAAQVAGVNVTDTVTIDGKPLKLNGAGLRKRSLFKVYVAALYVETPSKDAGAVLADNGIKSMQLHMLRDVKSKAITDAIGDGFQRNSKDQVPKLQPRLDSLAKMLPDLSEGDVVTLTWIPDKGTVVNARGTDRGTIEGRDFADALFAVWLGPDPVQDDLKAALLGAPAS
ncbi:MAG TPA: chalcone isomerase family protein [Thermoanaerobaculia bacterium]|jgi:hypothetical protein